MYRTALLAGLLLATALPLAANAASAAARTAQQQRMADCSAKNKGLKEDAFKQAQRSCLTPHGAPVTTAAPAATPAMAAHTAAAAVTPQQRMASCNTDASSRHLTGDARKTFMSGCLRSH